MVTKSKLNGVLKLKRDKRLGASLADELREQYEKRTLRIVRGDSVMVVRGEYKGRGGKVEHVDTKNGTLHIEGMQREKIKGGQVKVPIHSSNVKITGLNLEDKHRSNKLQSSNKPQSTEKKEDKNEIAEKKTTRKKESDQ